jgi:hypothetical protein
MTTPTIEDDRRRLADYLADHGAMHERSLREALRWTPARFWAAVSAPACEWFCLTAGGWRLTDNGGRDGPVIGYG